MDVKALTPAKMGGFYYTPRISEDLNHTVGLVSGKYLVTLGAQWMNPTKRLPHLQAQVPHPLPRPQQWGLYNPKD